MYTTETHSSHPKEAMSSNHGVIAWTSKSVTSRVRHQCQHKGVFATAAAPHATDRSNCSDISSNISSNMAPAQSTHRAGRGKHATIASKPTANAMSTHKKQERTFPHPHTQAQ